MKKIFSRKYVIGLISACGIGTGIALACAGDWGNEYGTSNFTPETFVDAAYSPFFYSAQFYYGIGHDIDQDNRFSNSNSREWTGYLHITPAPVTGTNASSSTNNLTGTNASSSTGNLTEIDFLLQKAASSTIDSAAAFVRGRSAALPASLQSFALFKDKGNKKTEAFLRYLALAKHAESYAANNLEYSWDYSSRKPRTDSASYPALRTSLSKAFTETSDPFLKERYWYQLVRYHFFNNAPQEAINLFNLHEKEFPRNTIYYRTLSYMAGAWYKQKNYSKANYYFSRVFDGCNELKTTAHYSFHPQEESDWRATLALCHDKEEQATLWQMLGIFYADEQRAIREIYTLDPKSEKLNVLLSRAINGSEQRFDGGNGFWFEDKKKSDSSNKALSALVTRIAEAGNTDKPWIWLLAAGYLHTLDAQFPAATGYFSRAQQLLPADSMAQAQFRLLKLLNRIASAKTMDTKTENDLREDLDWLYGIAANPRTPIRCSDALSWMRKTIARKYDKSVSGPLAAVKSECFNHTSGFYADDHRVDALRTFLEKPSKTPYEILCTELADVKLDDIYEYQAVRLAFAGKLDEAIATLGKTKNAATAVLAGNPFNARIQDCHDCDHQARQKVKYTKLSFLQKLEEIRGKIDSHQDIYTNAVLLGNAYYNMSHYGNARLFYECKIIGSGQSQPTMIDSIFKAPLTDMKTAAGYYTMALDNAATDEQKAKCQYLLAKCERNEWYNRTIFNKPENEYKERHVDFLSWKGFQALRQYPNTQYYKDVIRECGYFKTYSGR